MKWFEHTDINDIVTHWNSEEVESSLGAFNFDLVTEIETLEVGERRKFGSSYWERIE